MSSPRGRLKLPMNMCGDVEKCVGELVQRSSVELYNKMTRSSCIVKDQLQAACRSNKLSV